MTKSTITRERTEDIIARIDMYGHGAGYTADEVRELARMALDAMDSEPVELPLDYLQGHKDGLEWAAQLAKANHPETGDWLYDDPIELAKAISKGPDMPPSQPALDGEPVAWKWRLVDLATGDPGEWRVTLAPSLPGKGAGYRTETIPLYRHAQQPVVPATIPCSVELKPGLIIGKGCKTETLLTALRRRADYNADIDAMTPEERAELDASIKAFKAMLAASPQELK